jgi:hypothetical protein
MNANQGIVVRKRNGRTEPFDAGKLAGALWRGMEDAVGTYRDARDLAEAIEIYLHRRGQQDISSRAIFEMAMKVLRRAGLSEAAELVELHATLRAIRRDQLRVRHHSGELTAWDKSWLTDLGERIWGLSRSTARVLAAEVEDDLLSPEPLEVGRDDVVGLFNEKVSEFGLADAVPVR